MLLPFGEWLPDQAKLGLLGVVQATNVLPVSSGYIPMKSLGVITDALDDVPLGAFQGIASDLNVYQYAGDEAKLYENVSNAWTDRSKGGGYSTAAEERWDFTQWKNRVIATNYSDNPQVITFGGMDFADLTTDFKARTVATVRDFVVFGATFDASDGEQPDRVRWSAIDDETDYTVDPATLSDFQNLKTGEVKRILPVAEFGLILQRDAIWRMLFVGAPNVWQFDRIASVGAIATGAAIVHFDETVFFWSKQGFKALSLGTEVEPIGAEKVDAFADLDLDEDYAYNITTAADSKRIFWAYPGAGNTGGRPNRMLVYDRVINRWSLIEQELELIWSASGLGLTLEELDNLNSSIDALELSLDSQAYKGGNQGQVLAGFDAAKKSGFFDGDSMAAVIRTNEFEFNTGRQTYFTAVRPIVDGGAVTMKVGSRDNQADTIAFSGVLSPRASGRVTFRRNARYHIFDVMPSGDFSHAIGIQVEREDVMPGGRRGR